MSKGKKKEIERTTPPEPYVARDECFMSLLKMFDEWQKAGCPRRADAPKVAAAG
ncbi:MAG: hypothetical protein IKN60_04520 [Bacteroidales bacterium]|nr:hypothetical protein [Bacteroidales bacterium]